MNIAIFGATSEIGSSFIKTKSAYFKQAVLIGRNEAKLNNLLKELESKNNYFTYILKDATNSLQIKAAIDFLYNQPFELDVALFLIGYNKPDSFGNISEVSFNKILRTNLYSCFYFLKHILNKSEKTKIVILSSTSGLKGFPSNVPYGAAKHGIIGLVTSLKAEKPNVSIKIICPGLINTKSLKKNIEKQSKNSKEPYNEIIKRLSINNKWLEINEISESILEAIMSDNDKIIIEP